MEMWELKQRGHSAPYLSPELKAFPAGSYDPQGFWSSFEVTPIVLAFNTKLVPQDEAPRSYQDLLQPKWKGKMNMGSDEYAWYSVMLDGMGKAKGLEYMSAPGRCSTGIYPAAASCVCSSASRRVGHHHCRARSTCHEYKKKERRLTIVSWTLPAEPNALTLMRRSSSIFTRRSCSLIGFCRKRRSSEASRFATNTA